MHRGYFYAKIPQLPSFYKYLYPDICKCPGKSTKKALADARAWGGA